MGRGGHERCFCPNIYLYLDYVIKFNGYSVVTSEFGLQMLFCSKLLYRKQYLFINTVGFGYQTSGIATTPIVQVSTTPGLSDSQNKSFHSSLLAILAQI